MRARPAAHDTSGGVRLPLLLFAFLGPPVIWSIRFGVSYSLLPWVCATGGVLLLQALTLAALAGTAWAGAVGWRQWRLAGRSTAAEFGGADARARFMALVGMLGSALFLVVIIAEALPLFLIDPCQTGGVPL